MDAEISNALTAFTTEVTSVINPANALGVLAKVVGAAALLFFSIWAAKKIIGALKTALNGRLSINRS